jgi:hypothetical protein
LDAALSWPSKVTGLIGAPIEVSPFVTLPGAPDCVRDELDEAAVGRIFREGSGRSVAALTRVFWDIDIDVAEDAVQGAFAIALRTWPRDGVPAGDGAL